jgi:hypothetical protein
MKKYWKSLTPFSKVAFVLYVVLALAVVVLTILQLVGAWDNAVKVYVPLLALILIMMTITEWNEYRGIAIFSLCSAVITLIGVAIIFIVG